MGNYFSSKSDNNLEERVNKLQALIDQNKDNVVTKDELNKYFKEISDKVDKNSDGVITREELESYVRNQTIEQENETEKWKAAYEKLHNEYLELAREHEKSLIAPHGVKKSHVSISALQDHIENEIMKTDANLKYIPDALERKAYLSVYKTLMMSLVGLCNTTNIDIMNHRLSLTLEPIPSKNELIKDGSEKTKTEHN